MSKLYSIKPLEWGQINSHYYEEMTPFKGCYYSIYLDTSDRCFLGIEEDEKEKRFPYASIEEAKAAAWSDWEKRLSNFLVEEEDSR